MKLDNYKAIKKSEWQELARLFNVEFDENSVVRYLVEKIAEKLGIDDKIVNDNELKRQVVEKINSEYEVVPDDSINELNEKTIEEVVEEVKEENESISFDNLSRIEQLRLECESYGIAWTEKHTEENLEQVINGVKSAGVQPVSELPKEITKNEQPTTINTNEPFEITSANATELSKAVANMPNPAFNPLAVAPPPPAHGGYSSSNAYLKTYSDIYLSTIRSHFRVLSINEIHELINRDSQTFSHVINLHPQQQNKAEIILSQGSDKVRIPKDETDWLEING